jgi:aminopeptidase N
VDQVGFHEMAHQWWGHLVGWEGYRDQWLAEGLAEFSAALALNDINGWVAADKAWESHRMFILAKIRGSNMRNCDAGPISQGQRLATGRTPMAYEAMIYEKGAYVFHMLRMMMRDGTAPRPDDRFFALMQDFAKTYAGRNATTADFKEIVERHMTHEIDATRNGKMDWFFDQWVDGVEIPSYTSSFDIEKADGGKWRIHGTVKQERVSEGFLAMVPMYLDFGRNVYRLFGRAPFKGVMSHNVDVTLELPEQPRRVVVNAHHDVLAMD